MMGQWVAQNPEIAWIILTGATGYAVYYFGDKRYARKPEQGREYAVQPTEEEERAAKKEHEEDTIRLCNEEYVKRERYHQDMSLLTGQVNAIQVEMGKFSISLETMSDLIRRTVETGERQAEALQAIREHAASVDGAWSEWKRKEPLVIVRERIVGTADKFFDGRDIK